MSSPPPRHLEKSNFDGSILRTKNRKKTQTSRDIKNATKKHTTLKSVSRIYTTHASHTRERKRNAERFLPTFASSIQSNETLASLYCVSNGKFEICHKATCQRTPSWRTRSNNNNSKKLLHQHHRSSSSNNNNNNKEMTRRKLSRHRRI